MQLSRVEYWITERAIYHCRQKEKPDGPAEGEQPTIQAPSSTPTNTSGRYQQLNFNFTVPKGKVASLMGVLNYLQSKYGHMNVSLHLDRGQMTEQEYEDKVKEAFRQMGIDIQKYGEGQRTEIGHSRW